MAAGMTIAASSMAKAAIPTPEQVEGPFHPIIEQDDKDFDLTMVEGSSEAAIGDPVLIRGRVLDIDGNPLSDALVDIWQANYFGRYSHPEDTNTAPLDPNFQGWAVIRTDAEGRYGVRTIVPGPYPLIYLGEDGWRCKHIHFKVNRPGFEELITQMYFHEDPWIAQDPEVNNLPEDQRHLLIVKAQQDEKSGLPLYRFDITLATADA